MGKCRTQSYDIEFLTIRMTRFIQCEYVFAQVEKKMRRTIILVNWPLFELKSINKPLSLVNVSQKQHLSTDRRKKMFFGILSTIN